MATENEVGDRHRHLKVRLYQHEVLEKSLERNIIAAMPTGSESILFRLSQITIDDN